MKRAEYLQLETSDDVASVRDRLTFLRGKSVLLVWPEKGSVLTRKLDLVLIQREAVRSAVRIAIVTHDPLVIRHARELNISAFETINGSERGKWKRGRSRVFTTRGQRPRHEPAPDDLMAYASRVRGDDEETGGSRLRQILARALVLGLLGGVLLAAAFLIIPSATVTVIPARDFVRVEAQISADPNLQQSVVDVENGVMPAYRYQSQVEDTATVTTTGSRQLTSTPAIGSVIFINQTDESVDIPSGSYVSTSAGTPIVFRTTEDAALAAGQGQQVEVPIEAVPESAGEIGNVDVGLINSVVGDLAERVEVRNLAPTFQGASRSVQLVTQEDRDTLVAVLRQQIQDRAYRELAPMIAESQFAIPDTLRIAEERSDWMTFDHELGDVANTLTLTMRAMVEIIAVDEGLAEQIAYARLGAQVPRGRLIQTNTISYERGPVTEIDPNGRVTFTITCSADVLGQLNIQQIQERIASSAPDDALQYLLSSVDLKAGTMPNITIAPDWLGMLPVLPVRITVRAVDDAPPPLPEATPDITPEATSEEIGA
jgi:hypothetical protein